jgi:hypothetical protein
MIRRTALSLLIVCWTLASGATPPVPADDAAPAGESSAVDEAGNGRAGVGSTTAGVQFEATFAGVSGASLTTTNGHNQQREGELRGMYAAYASVPEGQPRPLVLRVTEDSTVNGPDGQPGVLRLQQVEIPLEVAYSGFLVYGHEETGRLQMPGWSLGDVTMNDLRRTFIEFKFRADNPNDPDRFGTLMNFRVEPDVPDSYKHRADFGALIATGRWRTFRRPIGSASNLDEFLKGVNEGNPSNFKLVWGQHGSIQNYAPGDSLLIDDLRIVVE